MLDFWYGDTLEDITKIEYWWGDTDYEYRGIMFKGDKVVGDFTFDSSTEIEEVFHVLYN